MPKFGDVPDPSAFSGSLSRKRKSASKEKNASASKGQEQVIALVSKVWEHVTPLSKKHRVNPGSGSKFLAGFEPIDLLTWAIELFSSLSS